MTNAGRGRENGGREQRPENVTEFEGELKTRCKTQVLQQGQKSMLVVKRISGQEVNWAHKERRNERSEKREDVGIEQGCKRNGKG
jgi:hypothetical protein